MQEGKEAGSLGDGISHLPFGLLKEILLYSDGRSFYILLEGAGSLGDGSVLP